MDIDELVSRDPLLRKMLDFDEQQMEMNRKIVRLLTKIDARLARIEGMRVEDLNGHWVP